MVVERPSVQPSERRSLGGSVTHRRTERQTRKPHRRTPQTPMHLIHRRSDPTVVEGVNISPERRAEIRAMIEAIAADKNSADPFDLVRSDIGALSGNIKVCVPPKKAPPRVAMIPESLAQGRAQHDLCMLRVLLRSPLLFPSGTPRIGPPCLTYGRQILFRRRGGW